MCHPWQDFLNHISPETATTKAAKAATGSSFGGDRAARPSTAVTVTAAMEIAPKLKIRFLAFMLPQPLSR